MTRKYFYSPYLTMFTLLIFTTSVVRPADHFDIAHKDYAGERASLIKKAIQKCPKVLCEIIAEYVPFYEELANFQKQVHAKVKAGEFASAAALEEYIQKYVDAGLCVIHGQYATASAYHSMPGTIGLWLDNNMCLVKVDRDTNRLCATLKEIEQKQPWIQSQFDIDKAKELQVFQQAGAVKVKGKSSRSQRISILARLRERAERE